MKTINGILYILELTTNTNNQPFIKFALLKFYEGVGGVLVKLPGYLSRKFGLGKLM